MTQECFQLEIIWPLLVLTLSKMCQKSTFQYVLSPLLRCTSSVHQMGIRLENVLRFSLSLYVYACFFSARVTCVCFYPEEVFFGCVPSVDILTAYSPQTAGRNLYGRLSVDTFGATGGVVRSENKQNERQESVGKARRKGSPWWGGKIKI